MLSLNRQALLTQQARCMQNVQAAAFASKQKKGGKGKKTEEPVKEKEPVQEEPKQEKEQKKETEEEPFDEEAYNNQENEFKTHRRVMYALGKAFKYSCWTVTALYFYHLYLVYKTDKPEEGLGANATFLEAAQATKWGIDDLRILMTRPPVNSLLLERPPLPPGYAPMKVLVLNLNGTLVHSEYKFGVGFEILKRPGLSVFLQRMARNYEIVFFGEQEQGYVNEIAEALDPQQQMIQARLGRESTMLKGSMYIKDFSYLGRPAKEVIYLDFSDETVPYHKDNCIVLPKWEGDVDDRALYDIIPFLESKCSPLTLCRCCRQAQRCERRDQEVRWRRHCPEIQPDAVRPPRNDHAPARLRPLRHLQPAGLHEQEPVLPAARHEGRSRHVSCLQVITPVNLK